MKRRTDMEQLPFLEVVDMSPESARAFFGLPPETVVEDMGPPTHNADRYKPEARLFRVWVPEIPRRRP